MRGDGVNARWLRSEGPSPSGDRCYRQGRYQHDDGRGDSTRSGAGCRRHRLIGRFDVEVGRGRTGVGDPRGRPSHSKTHKRNPLAGRTPSAVESLARDAQLSLRSISSHDVVITPKLLDSAADRSRVILGYACNTRRLFAVLGSRWLPSHRRRCGRCSRGCRCRCGHPRHRWLVLA
jgi:hypothetical protein